MPDLDVTAHGTAAADCLSGGGEMGAMMRAFDWATTPLGPVEAWPQSLRTSVSILLESKFPMYIAWGPDFTQFYNDGYRPILGSTKHPAALGLSTRETFKEIWTIIGPMFEGVMRGTAVGFQDFLLPLERHGFGEECYFIFSYSPIRDESGRVGGVLVTVTETTERVLGERRMTALRALAEACAEAKTEDKTMEAVGSVLGGCSADLPFALVYLLDADGRSARLTTAAGVSGDAAAAAPREIDLAHSRPWPLDQVARTRASITVDDLGAVGPLPHEEGQAPPHRARVLPIAKPGDDRLAGFLVAGISPRLILDEKYASFLDLVAGQIGTALGNARAYEEERRRAEALAELDRAKTAFFSNVSHEFRTPLTLMLGPLDDALSTQTALSGASLSTVQRNAVRLLKLVNTLLDFSRIEAGRVQASYQPTDLATLTADLASAFRSAVERAGLHFEVTCRPLSDHAFVDHDMWEKIVLNLLSNALKFTFDGSISIALTEEAGAFVLRVADTGCGIPAHELPHLFERFHRVHGARARTHEGSGIGLALVNELVRMHGGSVNVASTIGQGTTFTVSIPRGHAHLPSDRVRSSGSAVSATTAAAAGFVNEALRWLPGATNDEALDPSPSATALGSLSRPGSDITGDARILVADDNADMRDYLRRLLAVRWNVVTVPDGRAALEAARTTSFDVVLSDVMMPNLDGFGLLRELRADPRTEEVPFIMLSARAGEEARVEGLRAGVDDYLVKPFSVRELLARVESQVARVKVRQAQAEHTRRLRNLFEHAPVGICVLRGPDHVYEYLNPDYAKLLPNRDLVGKPIRQALPELAGQGIYELLDRVYTTGEPFVGRSVRLVVRRGTELNTDECFFDFLYQPMRNDAGEIDGIIVVVFEVTELERARHDAETANRAKDEFLAILGHELRNPLAPILTALELMRLRGDGSVERECTVIDRQVRHLVRLVDDLLDVSRVTRGKIELKKQPIDLSDVLAKAIEMTSPLLEERKHHLQVEVPRHGLRVSGDATRLGQVFSNILTNAAKYTEPGGRITVAAGVDGDHAVVSIQDTGVGIATETLPHIFELFVQERQSIDRSRGGLGLGLSIVRSLAQLHGGSVEAHSPGPGLGSTFVVKLPLLRADADALPIPQAPAPPIRLDDNGRAILIIDDNVDAADLLADTLRLVGCDVHIAIDGPSGLDAATRLRPSLVLLDIGLPVMDGYEVARRIRSTPALQSTRLIAVTGYGQESDRTRARQAGFDGHVVKPIDIDGLLGLISRLGDAARTN